MVSAPALDAASILAALEEGRFYASSGPVIRDVSASESSLRVSSDAEYVEFIAQGGRSSPP